MTFLKQLFSPDKIDTAWFNAKNFFFEFLKHSDTIYCVVKITLTDETGREVAETSAGSPKLLLT